MARKNVILFSGKNRVLRRAELARWERLFSEKHGEHNISRIRASDADALAALPGEISTPGFFGAARLVLVEGLLDAEPRREAGEAAPAAESPAKRARAEVLKALADMPETNFAVFAADAPEKCELSAWLAAEATVKEFKDLDAAGTAEWIRRTEPSFDGPASEELALARECDLARIEKDLLLFSTWKPDGGVTRSDVRERCRAEGPAAPWGLAAALENLDPRTALLELRAKARDEEPLALLSQTVSLLRRKAWALRLIRAGRPDAEVARVSGTKETQLAFLKRKVQSLPRLEALYLRLAELDWKAKTGQVPGGVRGVVPAFGKIISDLVPHA